ncbi:MAG: EI24 domain-containing protein [Bdellovibrio sp.]|nr:EI24 domain-containing protein [Bdellovibrio sp.]
MRLVPDLHYTEKISFKKVFLQTLKSIFYPEIILLLFLPLAISAVVVALLFLLMAGSLTSIYQAGLQTLTSGSAHSWFGSYFDWLAPAFPFIFILLLIAIAFPLIVVCNLFLTSILASSYLVKLIAKRDFPGLQPKGKARFVEGLLNSVVSVLIYLLAWIVTLPLWLIPGFQVALPVLLTAWLNRRICAFDALTDFASDAEFKQVYAETKNKSYLVGLITAGFNYVPLAFFISPVFTMVAFIYFHLAILQAKRSAASE